jgi:hypothetical protein
MWSAPAIARDRGLAQCHRSLPYSVNPSAQVMRRAMIRRICKGKNHCQLLIADISVDRRVKPGVGRARNLFGSLWFPHEPWNSTAKTGLRTVRNRGANRPGRGDGLRDATARERRTVLDPLLFFAGLLAIACCVLGGLYILLRHTSAGHDKLTRRKPPLAN